MAGAASAANALSHLDVPATAYSIAHNLAMWRMSVLIGLAILELAVAFGKVLVPLDENESREILLDVGAAILHLIQLVLLALIALCIDSFFSTIDESFHGLRKLVKIAAFCLAISETRFIYYWILMRIKVKGGYSIFGWGFIYCIGLLFVFVPLAALIILHALIRKAMRLESSTVRNFGYEAKLLTACACVCMFVAIWPVVKWYIEAIAGKVNIEFLEILDAVVRIILIAMYAVCMLLLLLQPWRHMLTAGLLLLVPPTFTLTIFSFSSTAIRNVLMGRPW